MNRVKVFYSDLDINISDSRETHRNLAQRGTLEDTFDSVIQRLLDHETAVSIIGRCNNCKGQFKSAIEKGRGSGKPQTNRQAAYHSDSQIKVSQDDNR